MSREDVGVLAGVGRAARWFSLVQDGMRMHSLRLPLDAVGEEHPLDALARAVGDDLVEVQVPQAGADRLDLDQVAELAADADR